MAGKSSRENGKKGGRPPGSTNRPNILSHWSEKDIVNFFNHMKKNYKRSDRIATWVGDQISGKASQTVELKGDPLNAPDAKRRKKLEAISKPS